MARRTLFAALLAAATVLGACAGSSNSTRDRLVGTVLVEGIPCKSYAHYREDGSLLGSQLAEEHTLARHRLPADTWFWLSESGELESCWLPRSQVIDGVLCRGGGKISVGFHPDGQLASAFLTEDTVIQGVPCDASLFAPVRFHPGGALAECRLSRDYEVGGGRFRKGERLRLDEQGAPTG